MTPAQKFVGLAVLFTIGLAIYFDPRCNTTCKRIIRGAGSSLFG